MSRKFILAIQVIPFTKDGNRNIIIDSAIDAIQKSGVKYLIGPCETVIEGTYEELIPVMEATQQACFDAGAEELMVNLKIERSRDNDMTLERAMGKHLR